MFYVIIEILIKENPTDIKNDEATLKLLRHF